MLPTLPSDQLAKQQRELEEQMKQAETVAAEGWSNPRGIKAEIFRKKAKA